MPRRVPLMLLTTATLVLTGCGPADAGLAPATRAQEAFPPKGETTAGLQRWLARNSRVPAESYVSIGDRYAVALVSTDYGGQQWVRDTQIHIEVVSDDFAARLGGRSAMLDAEVDCSSRRAKPKTMVVYPNSDLIGRGDKLSFQDRWIEAGQGAYLEDVISAACDPEFRRPFDPNPARVATNESRPTADPGLVLTPSARLGAYAPPVRTDPAAQPSFPPPAALKPTPPASPLPAPNAPPAPPKPVAVATAPPPQRPAPPPPKPAAAPAPAPVAAKPPPKPAPPPPPPVRVATAPPPLPRTAAPAPPPKPAAPAPAAAAGGFGVQIAAVPTMEQVEQAWTAASAQAPIRGRSRRVQTVEVGGKSVYRLMVAGFADKAAATSFCVQLKASGRDCLVRGP